MVAARFKKESLQYMIVSNESIFQGKDLENNKFYQYAKDMPNWAFWHKMPVRYFGKDRIEKGKFNLEKETKVPIAFDLLSNGDSTNPSHWTTFEKAKESFHNSKTRMAEPSGLAFSLLNGCNIAMIDIDGCRKDGEWNEFAKEIIEKFKDIAYLEVTQSGNGLRVFAEYTKLPAARKKNNDFKLEFYTDKRFSCITFNSINDSDICVCDDELTELIEEYLVPDKNTEMPVYYEVTADSEVIKQAIVYLQGLPPCKPKEANVGSAEDYCFAVASHLVNGFCLTVEQALPLFINYFGNKALDSSGQPWIWEESVLRKKLKDALRLGDTRGRGFAIEKYIDDPVNDIVGEIEPVKVEPVSDDIKNDPRFSYLWKGNHAKYQVAEADKLKRVKSLQEVYSIIPESGIFADYLRYASPQTNACPLYHLASLFGMMSLVLGNKCSIRHGSSLIRPNVMMILVGESTKSRKSTSVNIAKNLLPDELKERVLGGCFTSEGIYSALATQADTERIEDTKEILNKHRMEKEMNGQVDYSGSGLFFVDEFGAWLNTLNNSAGQAIKTAVTEWYDCNSSEWSKNRAMGKGYYIPNPYVSLLACSTPDWITGNSKMVDIGSGFFLRMLFIYNNSTDYTISLPDSPDMELQTELRLQLESFKNINGEFFLSEDAKMFYDKSYNKWINQKIEGKANSWLARYTTYVFKVAMFYHVATRKGREIQQDTLELAVKTMQLIFDKFIPFANEELVTDPVSKAANEILELIRNKPKITKQELCRVFRGTKDKTAKIRNEAINQLIDENRIVQEKGKNGRGQEFAYYRLTGE